MPSRVPTTLALLHTRAVTALAPIAGAVAHRGPVITGDEADWLFIGFDGNPNGDFRAVSVASEWVGLGAERREERFEVTCAVVVNNGNGDVNEASNRAYVLYDAFEAEIRTDPSLGQTPVFYVAAAAGDLYTVPRPPSLQAWLPFVVRVRTRI